MDAADRKPEHLPTRVSRAGSTPSSSSSRIRTGSFRWDVGPGRLLDAPNAGAIIDVQDWEPAEPVPPTERELKLASVARSFTRTMVHSPYYLTLSGTTKKGRSAR